MLEGCDLDETPQPLKPTPSLSFVLGSLLHIQSGWTTLIYPSVLIPMRLSKPGVLRPLWLRGMG